MANTHAKGVFSMPMFKKTMLVLLAIAVFASAGMLYGYASQEDGEQIERDGIVLDAGTKKPIAEQTEEIAVYVTGAVSNPGVVTLAKGSRTVAAVEACGGLLPTADADKVNMAAELKDGMQVRVPERAAVGGANAGSVSGNGGKEADGRININTADEKALDELPGVGPATARKIIEYREENGNFQAPEDLKKIRGIGDAKFEKLKDKVAI